jgi:transposase
MKKEARAQAEKMFMKAGGKITNRDIAKAVKVNALTVGRWKQEDRWGAKLKGGGSPIGTGAASGTIVRKKAARDKALSIYIEAEGNITNKELAKRTGVSPATVSKWKEQDKWDDQLAPAQEFDIRTAQKEEQQIDIGELVSPEQIVEINRRIENLLARDYLTAGEIADLATAKSDLLEAVLTYMDIVREIGEIETRG